MIDPVVPLVTAIVLAVLLLLVLALLLGHATWLGIRDRRLAAPTAAARTAVAEAIDGRRPPGDALAALQALPQRVRITVLADLAPTLRGVQRSRLQSLARAVGVLPIAERWAGDRRWWRRLHAIRVFTLLGGGEGLVERLLIDSSWEVRSEAAGWAAEHPSDEIFEHLLALLDDPQPLPRFAAMDALRRMGRGAAGPLTRLLKTASGAPAAAGLTVAVTVAEPSMLPSALRLAADDFPETRSRAAALLGALGGESAVAALLDLLADGDPQPRSAAAHALGHLGHWPAAGALGACLHDPAWEVRRNAALALRELGSPGLLLLKRGVDDGDRFASDIARQVLDLPAEAEEVLAS